MERAEKLFITFTAFRDDEQSPRFRLDLCAYAAMCKLSSHYSAISNYASNEIFGSGLRLPEIQTEPSRIVVDSAWFEEMVRFGSV